MDILDTIKNRHSVRQYLDKKIEEDKRILLIDEVKAINEESGLNIQMFFDEPKCFSSMLAHYGKFTGVTSYISLVGKKSASLDEKIGYYGERLVLLASSIGLKTCWVALTHGKSKAKINKDEKQVCLIALGYGENDGFAHKSKAKEKLVDIEGEVPSYFDKGVEACMLAPTCMNQQKFVIQFKDNKTSIKPSGIGFYSKVDLGIVKYHFEAVTGVKVE